MAIKSSKHSSEQTIDHDTIREWAEQRGGKPASVAGTAKRGEDASLLRIDFPTGAGNPPLEPISWDEFFGKFEDANLAMIYQEKTASGDPSYFCKFVDRNSVIEED